MLRKLRNRFRNMEELHRLVIICVIAIIALGAFGTVGATAVIVKYRSYDGDAVARITSVETTTSSVKGIKTHRYRAAYEFEYGGSTYGGMTPWISTEMEQGQDVPVRFDTDMPQDSMLQTEKRNTANAGTAIIVITLFGLLWLKIS